MITRKPWFLFGAILLFLGAVAGLAAAELSAAGNPFVWVTLGQVKVKAETVRTPEKLYLGLGYRQDLPEGQGMLFFLPNQEVQSFCMRGMQFPLDIIWIAGGRVIGIDANVPPDYAGSLISPEPVNLVLEVPGGFTAKYGVKPGQQVTW